MKKKLFIGNCTALVTPFTHNGKKVNYDVFKKIIDFQIDAGTSALVFMGTTGESPTLTLQEKKQIAQFAVNYVNHRIPVIVGAGSNSTMEAIKKCQLYEKIGVDGLLIVTPYYNKCSQEGLIQHYTLIARNTKLPIILYNVPSRTGVNILPKTVLSLSKIQNIVAIKEASGNIEQAMEIKRLCGSAMAVFSGDDSLTYPMLSIGCQGSISVVGNIQPKLLNLMFELYFSKLYEKSLDIHFKLLPLIKSMFVEVNPIPVKYACNVIGYEVGIPRLPLTVLSKENQTHIKQLLSNF